MNITKRDIVKKVASETGTPQAQVGLIYDSILYHISRSLIEGNDVLLPTIGKLKLVTRKPRRYVVAGREVMSPGYKTVRLVLYKPMKEDLNKE